MKYLLLALIVTSAFASEKEGTDYCESYLNQRYRTQQEISDLTRRMIELHSGHEEDYGSSVRRPTNCEDVPSDMAVLQHQREYLENKIKDINAEVARYCRRSYPM